MACNGVCAYSDALCWMTLWKLPSGRDPLQTAHSSMEPETDIACTIGRHLLSACTMRRELSPSSI
eukprot:1586835-Amphidinium_carterae.1